MTETRIAGYRDLRVWQRAFELALVSYQAARQFPRSELFELSSQIRRAAVSVMANIAEGNGRLSRAEYLHFLRIAHGSLRELEAELLLAEALGFLDRGTLNRVLVLSTEVGRMLGKMMKRLAA
ncbi:MAG TPA: four helix bundle protein [Gemmatimonadales bacterium]